MAVQTKENVSLETRARSGFTLVEVLVVIAIIGVLIVIAIPLLFHQTEQSRETVDLSNARSAYSEVMVAAVNGGENLKAANGDYMKSVTLNQLVDGWEMDVSDVSIGGIPSSEWIGEPREGGTALVIMPASTGKPIINWNASGYEGSSLMQLHAMPNDQRVAADQKTLKALGQAILDQGWTLQELKNYLGITNTSGNAVRIADYYQLKSGSYPDSYDSAGFKITSNKSGKLDELLRDAGFYGGKLMSTETSGSEITETYENSLFYSDELASNQFNGYPMDQTKRSIILNVKTGAGGKVTGLTIYSKAMDNQANMNNDEKKKFSFDLP